MEKFALNIYPTFIMNIGIDSFKYCFERDNHDKVNEIICAFSLKYILILESN